MVVKRGETDPCSGTTAAAAMVVKAPILGDFSRQCGDSAIDTVWFRDIIGGRPIDDPTICRGTRWTSLDYSLQLGEALANYRAIRQLGETPTAVPPAAGPLRAFQRELREVSR